jgi:hypothetical protein
VASWRLIERSYETGGWVRLTFADDRGRKETRLVPEELALDEQALQRTIQRLDMRPRSPKGLVERP